MSLEPTTIYLRDLPVAVKEGFAEQEISESLLISLCNQYTQINPLYASVHISNDINGIPFSYAYIQVGNHEEAETIISKLNFIKLNKKAVHFILFDDETQKIIKKEDGRLLSIFNLSSDIEVIDLYNIFKEYGDVIDCEIAKGDDDNLDDAAYVLFRKKEDACRAKEKLDGASLDNHSPIQIKYDHQNVFVNKFILYNDKDSQSSSDIGISSDDDDDDDDDENLASLLEAERHKNKILTEENQKLKKENKKMKKKIKEYEEKLKKFSESV